jgi:hypothetical protein
MALEHRRLKTNSQPRETAMHAPRQKVAGHKYPLQGCGEHPLLIERAFPQASV